jgi:1,4-alpha-glucan branching enzyme
MDPLVRQHHQDKFSFSMMYYYDENFMLPLSHDEVVHGKSPMLYKMPGDEWQKFANLRLLYTYMWTHPGAKLLFMGNEFGQTNEWNYKGELDWHLYQYDAHRNLKGMLADLNRLLKAEPALYELQFDPGGFEWVDLSHRQESVVAFRRKGRRKADNLLVILNFTPVVRRDWEIDIGEKPYRKEIFNSDLAIYWGSGNVYNPELRHKRLSKDSKNYRLIVDLPALGGIILK